jgi:hypothetical protein
MNRKPVCHICECKLTAWAPATKWGIIIVDYYDRAWLDQYGWSMTNSDRISSYAHSWKCGIHRSGSGYLHQAVTNSTKGQRIDHENGNGLDCRRSNMRPASQRQNTHNTRGHRRGTSQFKGVHFVPAGHNRRITPMWAGQIREDGMSKTRGYFANELDAAICYNYHAAHLFGDFARLNQIPRDQWAHE